MKDNIIKTVPSISNHGERQRQRVNLLLIHTFYTHNFIHFYTYIGLIECFHSLCGGGIIIIIITIIIIIVR